MTDPHYSCGSDDRDSLTQRHPDAKAKMLPRCARCGCVVYRIGTRVKNGTVLCVTCAEMRERLGVIGDPDD